MDTVQPGLTGATVLTSRTPTRRGPLDRGIAHRVSRTGTALALKDMEEPEPVPDFVRRGAALVVVGYVPAGDGAGEHIASVLVVGAAAWGGVGGEIADAQKTAAEVGEEVDV